MLPEEISNDPRFITLIGMLPQPICSQFIANMNNMPSDGLSMMSLKKRLLDTTVNDWRILSRIVDTFHWANSPEGYSYWSEVNKHLRSYSFATIYGHIW